MHDPSFPNPSFPNPSTLEAAQAAQAHADDIANALTVSELRYRRLFEAARDGILILDSETDRITDANPFMAELLGYPREEFIGKELWEIGLLQDKEASQEAFERLHRDGYIRYENLPLQNRSGARREVEFVSNIYRENGHSVIQCNIRDITERKRGADALRESEERLRLATEGAKVGVWKLIPATDELIWTARCCEIFGLPADCNRETTGELAWSMFHPEDVGVMRDIVDRAIKEKTDFGFEYRIIIPSGETRWVQSHGRPYYNPEGSHVRIEGVLSDITERKAAEQEISAAAARNERIALALTRPLLFGIAEDTFPDLSVATVYSSAWADRGDTVGGDFLDGFMLADSRIALVLGDVSGKGLEAAAQATEIKDVLRAFLRLYPYSPAQTLTRLNDYLCDAQSLDHRAGDQFVALAVAVLNPRKSEAVLAWAGIEPPLMLRANGDVEMLTGAGLPLGVKDHEVYADVTTPFSQSDTLMMSTDGLSEARSVSSREFLGFDGLIEVLRSARMEPSLKAMSEAIISGAKAFAGGQLHDDACLVLARRN